MEAKVDGRDRSDAVNGGKRPRVQKNVTAAIGADICSERYPAGSTLPRESDLCVTYGVSRTVIRESFKILETKGLVRSRPRVGTIICETEEWNLLDSQILEWIGPRILRSDLLDAILEARRTVEPAAAELAAQRATAEDIAGLERAWNSMRVSEGNSEAFTNADTLFHQLLLNASHNRVFRQLSSIIHAALRYALQTSNEATAHHDEALAVHRELIEALRMRNGIAARDCSNRMLDLALRDITIAKRRAMMAD
ncbi:FadR family transcriptional regulator [Rhizobium sp. KVB221]|uniref:FadR family transcriptional regulator n=1 Tax=Rhizobium setariae TaxID=2801340 RepID=A0A937CK36_9HYPH|nr:FadR family transcriptional regulator [Rhizobium setariae]